LTVGVSAASDDDADIVMWVVEMWRSVRPAAERLGLVPDGLGDLETLGQRLGEVAAAAEAMLMLPPMVCASTRLESAIRP
jgi:hypothetical protein